MKKIIANWEVWLGFITIMFVIGYLFESIMND